ncbi:hypothetical protein PHMEG_00026109 [Phytophthora megakarya]|uniref:Uncharacterized protein n=1 Tax=Phytophthora megakarya TaxID=4795 RepID=A0A225VA02_9STRA|nr:hypothetical protein PHMEG_00026109 [Phytophthora megakarya]
MTLTILQALGFQEQHQQLHKNPSILIREEDYLDDDDWDEHIKPRRRSSSVEVTLNSCLASISSSLNDACASVTTTAKKLYPWEPPHRGQLSRSMIENSSPPEHSLARVNSMPEQYRSSESDLDLFGSVEDELGNEDPSEVSMSKFEALSRKTPSRGTLSKFLSIGSWTQGYKKEEK